MHGEPVDDVAIILVQVSPAPDLGVDVASAVDNAFFGQTIDLTYRVFNNGLAASEGRLEDRYLVEQRRFSAKRDTADKPRLCRS